MKKIVRGNDFVMRIPVRKVVGGEQKPFPLPACTDVAVSLVGAYRRVRLEHEVDVADDSLLLARVEGDKIALGSYALEVKGKLFGNDWRSNEYEQVTIVDRNSEADTELGATDEGEPSVEMDTAIVIFPPTVELSTLISDTNKALDAVKETDKALADNEFLRVGAEGKRVLAESEREKAEKVRQSSEAERTKAEDTRKKQEEGRVASEEDRTQAETERKEAEASRVNQESARKEAETGREMAEAKREENETSRQEAEAKRSSDFNALKADMQTATSGAEKVDAKLEGNVLTVTNRNGEQKSVNLTDSDEHVTVNLTTKVSDVSMEGLILYVYVNNGDNPTQYASDSNGQVEFTIPKGATYKVVFPYVENCLTPDPIQHVASVGNRIIDVEYTSEADKYENVSIKVSKAEDISSDPAPWEGFTVHVTVGGVKTDYTTNGEGKVEFKVKNGTSYTVSVDKIDGLYEQYDRYTNTRTALASSYRYSFVYRSYESGIWLVDEDNKKWTFENWENSGNDKSKLMFICIKTLNTQRYLGDIYISLDYLANYSKIPNKQWCSQNVQFNNIPLNGINNSDTQYYKFAYNGLLATQTIIAEGDERDLSTSACDYCYGLTIENGENTYQGYLPTLEQWKIAWQNISAVVDAVNTKYPDLNVSVNNYNGNKWTSTQLTAAHAYSFASGVGYSTKGSSFLVIPFFACLPTSSSSLSLPEGEGGK